jgi:hypothetical protein
LKTSHHSTVLLENEAILESNLNQISHTRYDVPPAGMNGATYGPRHLLLNQSDP